MMKLKQKTISGLTWSFTESLVGQGTSFIVGIILARILSPKEFGLIGMLTIFVAISQSFANGGFSQALVRKQDCTSKDYSTVFYYNVFIGLLFYVILYASSRSISDFFQEPILVDIIRVSGLVLVINSFSIIQSTILTKNIDFKLQTKISFISSLISGLLSIYLALTGFGVWSLVALSLAKSIVNTFLLWLMQEWRPIWCFSKESFKVLFSFGHKLLISGLIDTIFSNFYYLIIGKFHSSVELGYYTKADQIRSLPSANLQGIIGRVSFPVLSSIQHDLPRLKEAYQKMIRSSMLFTFVLMLGLMAIAKPLVVVLIGDKWEPSVIYLQLLCLVGMFYPLHALNLNILQVLGRSDLFLRLEIIKKLLVIPVLFVGIVFGIKSMIAGMLINTIIAFYLNSFWSGRLIGYSFKSQVIDILPSFLLGAGTCILLFIEVFFIPIAPLYLLLLQLGSGILIVALICEGMQMKEYLYLKTIVVEQIRKY